MLVIPHLILKKDQQILLTKRAPTQKIFAGHWHCVTGGIENTESPRDAIIREAQEEIGIELKEVELKTTIFLIEKDLFDPSKKFFALELFFFSELPEGLSPVNREPLKQDDMRWFDINALPATMIPGVKFGINTYLKNLAYAEFDNT